MKKGRSDTKTGDDHDPSAGNDIRTDADTGAGSSADTDSDTDTLTNASTDASSDACVCAVAGSALLELNFVISCILGFFSVPLNKNYDFPSIKR